MLYVCAETQFCAGFVDVKMFAGVSVSRSSCLWGRESLRRCTSVHFGWRSECLMRLSRNLFMVAGVHP